MKHFSACCCLLLVFCLLFTACGIGGVRVRPTSDPLPVSASAGVHSCTLPREKMTRVARAGMTVLYYEETGCSIAVYDANAEQLWRALPEQAHPDAAMLTVRILLDGQILTLNSQDNCAPEQVKVSVQHDGVQFRYTFSYAVRDGEPLTFTLPLFVGVGEGCIHVSADCSTLEEAKLPHGARILSVALLPCFGAQTSGDKDDFLLLPDGSGSIVRTQPMPAQFEPIAVPVYTPDANGACARVAAFGQRVKGGAFVALAEKGDALMTVCAEKKTKKGGVNRVFPVFTLTESETTDRGVLYVSNHTNKQPLSLTYRFLADDTATAMGMAAAVRELLIRNGTLDLLSPIRKEPVLPFHLSLIGAATVQATGEAKPTVHTLTDFSAARELLQYLRSKGIATIRLRYRGLMLGGLSQRKNKLSSTVSGAGSPGDFTGALPQLGVTLFPEVRLLSAERTVLPAAAHTLRGKQKTRAVPLLQTPFLSGGAVLTFCAGNRLSGHAESLLPALRKLGAPGVCVADAAQTLYSDETAKTANTAAAIRDEVCSALSLLSAGQPLMLDGANLYAVKYAGSLLNVPLEATYSNSITTSVPFLQAILHGYSFYAGEPMNCTDDPQHALLLAAQTGAVPYYEWYAADFGTGETPDPLSYIHSISQAQQNYTTLQGLFDGLLDKPITAFARPKPGVTCTTFGSDRIYVNETDASVTIDGVTIEAKGMLRVAG